MEWYEILIGILLVLTSIAIVILVLMQQSRRAGLSGAISGGAETFFGKNKARTLDGLLSKITTISATLFLVLSLVLSLILK